MEIPLSRWMACGPGQITGPQVMCECHEICRVGRVFSVDWLTSLGTGTGVAVITKMDEAVQ